MPTNQLSKLFIVLSIVFFGTAGWIYAQEDTVGEETENPTTEEYVQGCAECHIDIVAEWQEGPHANAYHAEEIENADDPDTCLECHATGFVPFTGEFSHAGVTCEACHGETPAGHPDEAAVIIEPGLEVCATCHTTTFHEWEMSAHGEQQLACTSCHNPHPQQIRFGDNNALCTNCHEDSATEGYAHTTHVEEECTSCHWHNTVDYDPAQHIATGELVSSGHDAQVETRACVDCHEGQEVALVSDTEGEEGELVLSPNLEIQELLVEVESVRAQGQNTAAVRLIQGLLVGIAFGGIITIIAVRLRPGRFSKEES